MSFRNLPKMRLKIDGRLTALRVYEAKSFGSRARGLLGSDRLQEDEALWIRPCASVHTLGMRYAIDVLFLDREQRVIKVRRELAPLRFTGSGQAHSTLELLAGTAAALSVVSGSLLEQVPAC